MMTEFWHIMAMPFAACLVLTGIHVYLGLHVIERQVIFVDLALAQVAALGGGMALALGYDMDTSVSYVMSIIFIIIGAVVLSWTRFREQRVPQEAVIGIVYAVSAAALVLVLSRSGEGDEHIRQALIGNILLIEGHDVQVMLGIYMLVGLVHYVFRRQFLLISRDPEQAFQRGLRVRWWDLLFYLSFGIVVTSSVRVAGVLAVFSFLIIPSVCAMLFSRRSSTRLLIGWAFGALASLGGMAAAYVLDLPVGASVVCVFGMALLVAAMARTLVGQAG